jgi:hypothetical protein
MTDPLALARTYAERPDLWRHLVHHDPHRRTFELLRDDDEVTAWVICWSEDTDTGFHDHGGSAGAGADIHSVRHAGGVPAVTIHVYSPPLRRQGAYAIGADGTLTRLVLSETEELRPLQS